MNMKKICNGREHAIGIVIGITALVLLLAGDASAAMLKVDKSDVDYKRMRAELQMLARIEANGTHFELSNSSNLNITLYSSEPIKLFLESAPEMVNMRIESASGAASAQITLSGFVPQTTYHKYEDEYYNHTAFTTDAAGNYTYTQDLSSQHIVFIQPRPSIIKIIRDDATGGDCTSIGIWIASAKTCILRTDLTETILIASNGITLDGSGHTISGSGTGCGVCLLGRQGVKIMNLNIRMFYNGISLYSSSNNNITRNNALENINGIFLRSSNNNTLSGNNASNNNWSGIYIDCSNNNMLDSNTANLNNMYGIALGFPIYLESINSMCQDSSNNNILINNTANSNDVGFYVGYSSNNILSSNTAKSNEEHGIFLGYSNNNILSSNTASSNEMDGISLGSSNNNVLINNTANSNKWDGFSLWDGSSHNTMSGNTASNNNWNGIYLSSGGNNVYNNIFNNTNNFNLYGINYWNTTKTAATNIVGGPYLGGNFWANPNGKGFSQTCADANGDGICDSSYTLAVHNIDYLPLSMNFTLQHGMQ